MASRLPLRMMRAMSEAHAPVPLCADPVLRLSLRGVPRVHGGEGASAEGWVLPPRDALMLAWLVLEGPTPRARLARLLWADSSDEAARNALRQRLFQLRRQCGRTLADGGGVLALADGVAHDLDDADDLLAGLTVEVGEELAAWWRGRRAALQARRRAALTGDFDAAEAAGDWPAALGQAQALLALDPLSEVAHRRLMRVHYLAGDRAAALLAFDRCERMLKDEVGASPSPETLALLRTVEAADGSVAIEADGASSRPESAVPRVPVSLSRPPRLVGRDPELAALQAALARGEVAVVLGEAGLGKSRLTQTATEGLPRVLRAAGRPGDAGVPYATLARLLRAAAPAPVPGAPAGAVTPPRELARVLPEFAHGTALRDAGSTRSLQAAVRDWLWAADVPVGSAASTPPVFIVDDLHFADDASLEMLQALLADQEERPDPAGPRPRWLLAWRDAEAGPALRALHEQLIEGARFTSLALAPLDEPALAALVDSLALPGLSGPALAPALRQRTGGNPMFVLETLKQWWLQPQASPPGSALVDAEAGVPAWPRPVSVGRLITRRLARLSPGALALARVAAVAGTDFGIALAEQVLGRPALHFADALAELEAAQVMRGDAFAHDLVFEAVREGLPATIAAHTHGQVADWLAPRGGEPARVAGHLIAAGRGRDALPWLGEAAERARRALRTREAVAFLEARSALEAQAGLHDAAFDTLFEAGELFISVHLESAHADELCEGLDRLARTPRQRLRALQQRINLRVQQARYEESRALAEQALPLAEALGDPALLAQARMDLGSAFHVTGDSHRAERLLLAASAWYDTQDADAQRAVLHGELAALCDNAGRLEDALIHHRRTAELCQRLGDLGNAVVAGGNFACNRIDAGDLAEADAVLARSLALAASVDDFGGQRAVLLLLRALVSAHAGRPGAALEHAESGLATARRFQSGMVVAAELRLGWVWWHLGQWSRVTAALQHTDGPELQGATPRAMHARLGWRLGRGTAQPAVAAQAAAAMRTLLDELGEDRPDLTLAMRLDLAEALPPDEAVDELEAVVDAAAAIGHTGTRLAAMQRRLQALAELPPGDPRAAPTALAQAAEAVQALHAQGRGDVLLLPAEMPWSLFRAWTRAGDEARAHRCLDEGLRALLHTAGTEVPSPFRDAYLERQPLHQALRREAARRAG